MGAAVLVALLVLACAGAPAQAQMLAPPDDALDQPAPDQVVDPGNDWDPDHHDHGNGDHTWPDDTGGAQPGSDAPPADPDAGSSPPADIEDELPAVTTSYIPGTVARMRTDGKAAIPQGAPMRVRSLISQYNRIVGKRYKWGGGHGTLVDTGYDCSGAVGYGLIKGGLLNTTMVSGSFARWGAAGAGRWVTIYAHSEHVYIEVAGLRLDTSAAGDRGGRSGVRWRPVIGQRRGFKIRHPIGL
jgi:hypothetical protein